MNDFRTRLLMYIGERNLTVRQFEAETGIPYNTVVCWRIGRGLPSYSHLRKLVQATGLSADWWLGLK
jgi:transcriptional regulator with XRE-family HTH domain